MSIAGRSPPLHDATLAVAALAFFGAPSPLLAQAGASCPVPVDRQLRAIAAFAELLPVFRHARCINCHGAIDPLSEAHRGAGQLDPEIDRFGHREQFIAQCQDCHDQLSGWTIPGEPVFFVGKSDEELCTQMKFFEPDPAHFVGHIRDDNGGIQFIAAGFAGNRALDEQSLRDYGLVVEKPPGTQAALTAKAQRWVDLVGEGYASSPGCGCKKPALVGTFTQSATGGMPEIDGLFGVMASVYRIGGNLGYTIRGELVLAAELPDAGAREDQPTIYRPSAGHITVEIDNETRSVAGKCVQEGSWTIAIESLPERALANLFVEIADSDRYRLSLGMSSMYLPVEVEETCRVGVGGSSNERVAADAAIALGVQAGQVDAEGIHGSTAAPVRDGGYEYTGSWSFKSRTN